MKKIILILAVLISNQALASYPKNFTCVSKAKLKAVRTIKFENMHTFAPSSSISDATLVDWSYGASKVSMSFSNECDNLYSISFDRADLEQFAEGEIKSFKGRMDYSQNGSPAFVEENVELTCFGR